jgi:DNA-binding transcriptional LysR family regulator
MLPDFNRLKVFYYICLDNSIASAAKELHVTQSAVSQHLKKLETELKMKLFTRLHKRLLLTSAGKELFDVVQPFIHNLREHVETMRRESGTPRGVIKIGAPVEFGESCLPGLFNKFRKRYPDVSFELELGHPTLLLPKLGQNQLDVVFADIYSKKGEYSRELAIFSLEPVLTEKLVLVCSSQYHEERIKADLSLENLLKQDYISYQTHAPAIRNWFKHHFDRSAVKLNIVFTVESVQGVKAGINHHLGLGIIPRHLVDQEINAGNISLVSTSRKDLINRISLVQLLDKVPTLTEKTFLSFCRSYITSIHP